MKITDVTLTLFAWGEFFEVLLPAAALNRPGLGAAIDFALIEREKVAVLSSARHGATVCRRLVGQNSSTRAW